jgi:hypothetical protein
MGTRPCAQPPRVPPPSPPPPPPRAQAAARPASARGPARLAAHAPRQPSRPGLRPRQRLAQHARVVRTQRTQGVERRHRRCPAGPARQKLVRAVLLPNRNACANFQRRNRPRAVFFASCARFLPPVAQFSRHEHPRSPAQFSPIAASPRRSAAGASPRPRSLRPRRRSAAPRCGRHRARRRGEPAPSSLSFPILPPPPYASAASPQPLVAPFHFAGETSLSRCPVSRPSSPARDCSLAAQHLASAICATRLVLAPAPPHRSCGASCCEYGQDAVLPCARRSPSGPRASLAAVAALSQLSRYARRARCTPSTPAVAS